MQGSTIRGRVWRFGDNIATDQIFPARHNVVSATPEEIASHAMEDADPEFTRKARPGDIIVGGFNFGCGSSRENAVHTLRYFGLGAVIAEYFGRIFFRNAINVGLPAIEAEGVSEIAEGEEVEIDLELGEVRSLTTGRVYRSTPVPAFLRDILNDGGLMPYLEKRYLGEGASS